MKIESFLIGLIISLSAIKSNAQSIISKSAQLFQRTLSGKVTDEKKIAIPYATVTLKIQTTDSTYKRVALTDLDGLFSISSIPVGKTFLSLSNVGSITLNQELSFEKGTDLKLPDLLLKNDPHMLDMVTVNTRKPLIQQKPDRTVMNVSGSILASGNSLYNILEMSPSIELINGRLTMNGKSNVLIVLNGKKLPNTTLESLLSSIPGDQIERIEFIHNPSSKYDASASGGVIEIYTKRSTKAGWSSDLSGNFSQGYRSKGGLNAGFRLSTPKFDWDISGSYSSRGQIQRGYSRRELFQGHTIVGNFNQDVNLSDGKAKDKNLNSSFNYQLSKSDVIGADISLLSANLNGLGTIDAVINEPNETTKSHTFNDTFLKIAFSNYNLFYKKTLDSLGSNLMVTANYAQYTSKQQQEFNQTYTNNSGNTDYQFRNNAPSIYNIYTGTADYTKNLSNVIKLETGLKYTLTDNKSSQAASVLKDGIWKPQQGALQNLGYQERIYAGYVNYNQKFGKLSFQAGLRAEKSTYKVINGIDSGYFNLFPNVRLDYQFSNDYSSSLSYAKNINRPSYENLIPYELFIDNYTSRRGNTFLKPEYTHTFSWNQIYKKYSLNLSYTRTAEAISTIVQYDEPTLRFIETTTNFRTQQLLNATLSAPVKITSWWNMNNRVSAYWRAVKFPSTFASGEIINRNKATFAFNTLNSFKFDKGYSAEVSAYYNSSSILGMYTISGFSNVSAGIRKSLFNDKAFIKLDVSDIFYQNFASSSTDIAPIITRDRTKNDSRRIRLSFRYTFDKNTLSKKAVIKSNGNSSELDRLSI